MPLDFTFDPGAAAMLNRPVFATIRDYEVFVEQAMRDLGSEMAPILRRHTPIGATGRLRASTGFRVTRVQDAVVLDIIQPARSSPPFGPARIYRPWASMGRMAGRKPPFQALMGWVSVKFGLSNPMAIRRSAFGLAAHIGRRGTRANPYTFDAFAASASAIQTAVDKLATTIAVRLWDFSKTRRP